MSLLTVFGFVHKARLSFFIVSIYIWVKLLFGKKSQITVIIVVNRKNLEPEEGSEKNKEKKKRSNSGSSWYPCLSKNWFNTLSFHDFLRSADVLGAVWKGASVVCFVILAKCYAHLYLMEKLVRLMAKMGMRQFS